MNYKPVVPAIIPKSKEEVIEFSKSLSFSPEIQLDLVDGRFVRSICWPYDPVGEPMEVKRYLDAFTLEIDLMVENPMIAAKEWVEAGADMVIFHVETVPVELVKNFADKYKVSVGVSAHGDTSIDKLSQYVEVADYIQLMGIYEIGAQGLPFDEEVIDKIVELKKRFPMKSITIDGSVNAETIKRLSDAGADRFICGSAISGQEDPESAHEYLSGLINS